MSTDNGSASERGHGNAVEDDSGAKFIARYPEFKREQFAEYFLIGTLLSLSAAIVGGVILLKAFYGSPVLPQ